MGKTLLMVGVALAAYQAYKRWRRRRALSRLSGKVVLITGASSGLGEGEGKGDRDGVEVSLSPSSSCQAVSQCGCKGHPCIQEYAETPGSEIPTGHHSHTERGVCLGHCVLVEMRHISAVNHSPMPLTQDPGSGSLVSVLSPRQSQGSLAGIRESRHTREQRWDQFSWGGSGHRAVCRQEDHGDQLLRHRLTHKR